MNKGLKMNKSARTLAKGLAGLGLVWTLTGLTSGLAHADLKLCNKTPNNVGVALGYKDRQGWASEGWWNIGPNACETLLRGELIARYYYIYAVDYKESGSWGGKAILCTRDKLFTIRGIKKCIERGYKKTGFFEVDTGEEVDWSISLSGPKTTTKKSQ